MSAQIDTTAETPVRRPILRKPSWWRKPVIYRFARDMHSYLSALAFVALIFFAATGFFLNHPEWLKSSGGERETIIQLSQEQLVDARLSEEPARAIADLLKSEGRFVGTFSSGEVFDDEAMLRFTGVKGDSDVFVNLATGEAEIESKSSGVMTIIRDLHRGKEAGFVWKLLIDVVALFTLALSLIGFFLFFTMKFRLATSMKLTVASLGFFAVIFVFFVA